MELICFNSGQDACPIQRKITFRMIRLMERGPLLYNTMKSVWFSVANNVQTNSGVLSNLLETIRTFRPSETSYLRERAPYSYHP